MGIELLYFAWVREAIGKDGETAEPPADAQTVGDLVAWLAAKGDGYGEALGTRDKLRVAVDQVFAGFDTPLDGVREIAIFPPVTGG
ncbi:molybdopterin converting factor subunit 1 [Parasphingopyxis marina]|uniref:Molybdopterin synthase sulfur carrier subunit n=1 Tax=Parasphingopyxis marina TaxID=2761622 RepID=A0A842HTN5_9SPHN|nr:molybdopterin converting factor subunit 1 [Parasphingopyxis marina]MBC2777288.1 molybdopterin converting factor subunit 1 [Parasphingopyxis marina]